MLLAWVADSQKFFGSRFLDPFLGHLCSKESYFSESSCKGLQLRVSGLEFGV